MKWNALNVDLKIHIVSYKQRTEARFEIGISRSGMDCTRGLGPIVSALVQKIEVSV